MKVSKNDVLKVEAIIQHCGEYREKSILSDPHYMEYTSWGNGHKLVKVARILPRPDLCTMFCIVDVTICDIVG